MHVAAVLLLGWFLIPALPGVAHPQERPPQEIPVLDARLGPCSADFTVHGTDGRPVYGALIHVRVRYGPWSIKRSDLEVGTNSDGRARIAGLPEKARLLRYDVRKDALVGAAEQDVRNTCEAAFVVSLAPAAPPAPGR